MQLTIVKQTAKTVTLGIGGVPAACDGFVFKKDGTRVSNTWDSTKNQVTFGIDSQQHSLTVSAQGEIDSASVIINGPPNPPTPTGLGSVYGRWFKDDTYWNRKLAPNTPHDAQSDYYMTMLKNACPGGAFTNGQSGGGAYSVPIYYYDDTTPTKNCALVIPYKNQSVVALPYLPNFAPSPGDGHTFLVHKTTGVYYESQGLVVSTHDGSLSAHSIAMGNVISGDGVVTPVDRISICVTGAGLQKASEILAGVIPHALRAAIPVEGVSTEFRPPADYSDGDINNGWPGGLHVQLDPAFDISPYNIYQQMELKAMQDYGWINSDDNGDSPVISLSAESVCDGCSYPFNLDGLPATIFDHMWVVAAGY